MDKILIESASKKKYAKKYKCPFCDNRFIRQDLSRHIEKNHYDLIPEGYSAIRVSFNTINKKETGHCIVCGNETMFNEKKARYERLCTNPACKKKYNEMSNARTKKIHGKTGAEMLDDVDFQEKMLANRKISGTYNMRGTKFTYTGTYEKKCLEFLDKVLEINPEDLQCPGPAMKYKFKNPKTNEVKNLWYIPDMYYIPYNLLIEIKDGGNNKNTRPMMEYRAKQLAKEEQIVKDGKYNYLRLTNNNFGQLMTTMSELKLQLVEDNTDERIIRINESTVYETGMMATIGAMLPPEQSSNDTYIANLYNKHNVFSGYAFSDRWDFEEAVLFDFMNEARIVDVETLFEGIDWYSVYKTDDPEVKKRYGTFRDFYTDDMPLYEFMMGHPRYTDDQIMFEADEIISYYDYMKAIQDVTEASLLEGDNKLVHLDESFNIDNPITIKSDLNGYYAYNKYNGLRTRSVREKSNINPIELGIIVKGVVPWTR